MAIHQEPVQRSSGATNLADILERVLDKGIVIAGDIKLSLGEIEILTLQIRLVVCSVDKAREMGMDWWVDNPSFSSKARGEQVEAKSLKRIEARLAKIEKEISKESKKED